MGANGRVLCAGLSSDSMNSATIRDTDLPRRRASALALFTRHSSTCNVSFLFMVFRIPKVQMPVKR